MMEDIIENKNNGLGSAATCGGGGGQSRQRKDYFNIKTHKIMLKDAFVGADFPQKAVKRMLFGVGFWSDVVLMMKESVHLDNHRGNECLVAAYRGAIDGFHRHSKKRHYIRAGVCLHTIGDFYAHSNFIDLYSLYSQERRIPIDLELIPTFSTLMDDKDFLLFAKEHGELRAGTYGLLSDIVEKIFKTKPKEGSHTVMNLDSNKSINGGKPFAPGATFTKHEASVKAAYEECKSLLQHLL